MWQSIKSNPVAAIAAVLAHVIFLVVLGISFTFTEPDTTVKKTQPMEVIEAMAVDEKEINAELERIRQAERRKQKKLEDDARKARDARKREEKRLAALKQKRKEEEQKRKLAEKKRKADETKRKAHEAAEKKRLAELKKKREEAERKRQQEEKRLAELEKKRKEEEERAKQEELARQEAEMKKKLEAERAMREAAQRRANQSEINKYRNLIMREVSRHWIIPTTAARDLNCDVKVRLIPSGDVVDVQVIKSSGNRAFDRSVETAVYRAAPLPVPSVESGLFDEFREVIFSFDPKNISDFG